MFSNLFAKKKTSPQFKLGDINYNGPSNLEPVTREIIRRLFGINQSKLHIEIIQDDTLPPQIGGYCHKHPQAQAQAQAQAHIYQVVLNPNIPVTPHTVAHELAHVRQFFSQDLEQTPEGITFRGRLYPNESLMHQLNWHTRPWELEAEGVARYVINSIA